MNKFFKYAIFFTSFLPLWISILFIDLKNIFEEETCLYTEYISIVFILLNLLISIMIILKSIKVINNSPYKVYKIIDAVQEKGITSEFLLSYILPLFAFDFTRWDSVIQFMIYFSILSFLCIRNNNVYVNLVFEFLKYKFYSCELQWVSEPETGTINIIAISRKNLCANKGNTIESVSLNKPFYLIK